MAWLEYCPWCKRKHLVEMRKCTGCFVYETPQPVSDTVADSCGASYECDGCAAYREHANPY